MRVSSLVGTWNLSQKAGTGHPVLPDDGQHILHSLRPPQEVKHTQVEDHTPRWKHLHSRRPRNSIMATNHYNTTQQRRSGHANTKPQNGQAVGAHNKHPDNGQAVGAHNKHPDNKLWVHTTSTQITSCGCTQQAPR